MFNYKGISLIEVLISLFLLSTVFLSCSKMQWQVSRAINHTLLRVKANLALNNLSEASIHFNEYQLEQPLSVQTLTQANEIKIKIMWQDSSHHSIERMISLKER